MRKWSQTDRDYWRIFVSKLCQLLRTKTLTSGSERIKQFFYFYHCLPYICWGDVIYLTCLVFLKSPWWLVWTLCAPTSLNLKNEIAKIEHKKISCGPSKILKNISWPINIWLKYFMTPTKTLRPPSYILNVRSLTKTLSFSIRIFFFQTKLFI